MTKHGHKADRFMRWLKTRHLGFRHCGDMNRRGESVYVIVMLSLSLGELIVRFSDHAMVAGGCYSKTLQRRMPQPDISVDPSSGHSTDSVKELVEVRLAGAAGHATMAHGA